MLPAVPAMTVRVVIGPVLSTFMVKGEALVANPALLVQEPLKTAPAVSVVWNWFAVQVTGLLIVSVPLVWMVTSLVYQPLLPSVPEIIERLAVGPVLSILIVTEAEPERPALFVAEQVSVVPDVSEVRLEAVQPVEVLMPDSVSVTVQLTVTSLVYQPFDPAVPEMDGVITGAVLSKMVVSL